jgi:hypothetical protein
LSSKQRKNGFKLNITRYQFEDDDPYYGFETIGGVVREISGIKPTD